jgi:hypothetical protein
VDLPRARVEALKRTSDGQPLSPRPRAQTGTLARVGTEPYGRPAADLAGIPLKAPAGGPHEPPP